jgi:hypothetical protein
MACRQGPPAAEFKIVAEAFLEFFELLEEYAPVWYTEQHHNRAMTAKRILERSREQSA